MSQICGQEHTVVSNSEGIARYKLAVTKWSRGCDVQHRECINSVVVTVHIHGARWVLEKSGGTLYEVHDCLTTTLYT